jgi:hypothetical protein
MANIINQRPPYNSQSNRLGIFPPTPSLPIFPRSSDLPTPPQHERRGEEPSLNIARMSDLSPDPAFQNPLRLNSESRQRGSLTKETSQPLPQALSTIAEACPADEVLSESSQLESFTYLRFARIYAPIPTPTANTPLTVSYHSLNTASHLITHETSDGGLATSTHRLAAATGEDVSQGRSNIFGPKAKAVHLPKLNSFLGNLSPTSFSEWTKVLTPGEIREYQVRNHRKFPLLHLIPPGLSLNDVKAGKWKLEPLPGFENDFWKFLVEVCVLTAGSPYGKYMTVDIFRSYTKTVLSLYSGHNLAAMDRVMQWTGEGCLALTAVFLIMVTLVYKCRRTHKSDALKSVPGVYF